MEIRKLFKVEAAQHVVRNATARRCSHSVHNHGAVIEVFLTSNKLDNAQMICDFTVLKGPVKQFIDSFDHCMTFWSKDDREYIDSMKRWNERWIELAFNPTAEMLALYFCYVINQILEATEFNNGEGKVECSKVIYHETDTGYACATKEDLYSDLYLGTFSSLFSQGVMKDWSPELYQFIMSNGESAFINPKVEQQVL